MCFLQAVERLVQGADSGCPSEKERQIVLNCTRLLTRILPYIFEDADWRGFFWSTVPGAGRSGVKKNLTQPVTGSTLNKGHVTGETLCWGHLCSTHTMMDVFIIIIFDINFINDPLGSRWKIIWCCFPPQSCRVFNFFFFSFSRNTLRSAPPLA